MNCLHDHYEKHLGKNKVKEFTDKWKHDAIEKNKHDIHTNHSVSWSDEENSQCQQ